MKKEKAKEAKKAELEKRNLAKVNSIIYPSQVDEKHNESNGYIVIKNLNKIYDNDVQAVFDFNLNINNNEFIVLVGPSGCGKSTTLRMICGLEDISSGELFINRVYTNELPPKDRDIAMVFQSYALYPHMSVFDNMAFGLKIKKVLVPVFGKDGKPVLSVDQRKIKQLNAKKKNLKEVIKESTSDIDSYHKEAKNIETKKAKLLSLDSENTFNKTEIVKLEKSVIEFEKQIAKLEEKLGKADEKTKAEIISELSLLKKENSEANRKLSKLKAKTLNNVDFEKQKLSIANRLFILQEKENYDKSRIARANAELLTLDKEIEKVSKEITQKYVYKHMPKAEIEKKVNDVAEILEITKYLNRKPKALSGGQRQRVALGRAIVRNAAAFLMDEPLSNLDAKLRVQMRAEIVSLHRQIGATTIYVTHDQTEAMTMADRIVVMNEGIVQQIGAPRQIYEHPVNLFVATFIGAPAMNIVKAKVQDGVIELANGFKIKLTSKQIEAYSNFYKNEIERLKETDKRLDNALKDETDKRHDVYLMAKDKIANIIKDYTKKLSGNFTCFFGVRPEDIETVGSEVEDSMPVNADVVELLGSEYYIYSKVNKEKLVLKVASNQNYNVDDNINIRFNVDRIHIFDDFTERALF